MSNRRWYVPILLAAEAALLSTPASPETLKEALASTYRNNPALEVTRSQVRAADEAVAIANGRFRPTIAATGDVDWNHTKLNGSNGTTTVVNQAGNLTQGGTVREGKYGINISQTIFNGFQSTNQVRVAEAGVRAARAQLCNVERDMLLQTVAAYAAILIAIDTLRVEEENLKRLDKVVRTSRERVNLTELTNTDLSQAELARTRAVTRIAETSASLKAARATYLTLVGHDAGRLHDPALPGGLPKSLAEAQAIAAQENPLIIMSLYNEEGARHAVDLIRGQLLPQITLGATWEDTHDSTGLFQREAEVVGRLVVPLYEGGQVYAAVRQAKQLHLGSLQSIEVVRGAVQRAVAMSWAQLDAKRTRVSLGNSQVRAAEVALEGVRKEEGIGQRTLYDVLVAEQALLDAKLFSIEARRQLVVAHYDLLSQIGRLDVERLGLDTMIYDPTVHYEEVRRQWFGLDITHSDGRREHVVVGEHGRNTGD